MMNKMHQDYLFQSFPELFDKGPDTAIAQWGFEVGDGWYGLLERMCHDLSKAVRTGQVDSPRIHQIKSKFGRLVVRTSTSHTIVEQIIATAIESSKRTCETCGAPGDLVRRNRWSVVACSEHVGSREPAPTLKPPIFAQEKLSARDSRNEE